MTSTTIITTNDEEITISLLDILFLLKTKHNKYFVYLPGDNEYEIGKEEYERLKKVFVK